MVILIQKTRVSSSRYKKPSFPDQAKVWSKWPYYEDVIEAKVWKWNEDKVTPFYIVPRSVGALLFITSLWSTSDFLLSQINYVRGRALTREYGRWVTIALNLCLFTAREFWLNPHPGLQLFIRNLSAVALLAFSYVTLLLILLLLILRKVLKTFQLCCPLGWLGNMVRGGLGPSMPKRWGWRPEAGPAERFFWDCGLS